MYHLICIGYICQDLSFPANLAIWLSYFIFSLNQVWNKWVKGHSGVEGNEQAGRRAQEGVAKGVWKSDPSLATPAGIRQMYQLFQKKHMKWDRDEVRGLTYLHMDKGPMRHWLFKIGKAEDPRCECGGVQNAAHLLTSGCVGGKKR